MRTILLLSIISLCGCTTMRTVAPGDLQAALDGLRSGEQIAVQIDNTWHQDLIVSSVSNSSVQAANPDGESVTFVRSEVNGIQVRVGAPGKTAGLAAGIFFGVLSSGIPGLSL